MSGATPRTLLVGFHTDLNQGGVRAALDRLQEQCRPVPFLALASRENFLGDRADAFLPDARGFRQLDWAASRAWPAPDGRTWERLRPAEAVAMKMMDRTQRASRAGRAHESRKARWLQWATFAHGFLRQHGIERLVHCNVPHFPFQYVLFEVARALGLEVRFLMQLQVKDTFMVADRIDGLYEPMGEALSAPAPEVALRPRMEQELARRTGRATPFYMTGKGVPALARLHARQRRFFRGWLRSAGPRAAYRAARRRRGGVPEEGSPFVYLPLHLQPEATTLPLAGAYEDQRLIVETLVRALPEGWQLVVKENPKQRFDKRTTNFYETLAAHERLRLVGRDEDSFGLLLRSRAVATATGTAGWEALCHGIPALVFGNAFYRHAPGARAIDSVESASAALTAIHEGRFNEPTEAGCRAFLANLQGLTFEGVSDSVYLRDSEVPVERSAEACARAVEHALTGAAAAGPVG